jgi:hypothetical protein
VVKVVHGQTSQTSLHYVLGRASYWQRGRGESIGSKRVKLYPSDNLPCPWNIYGQIIDNAQSLDDDVCSLLQHHADAHRRRYIWQIIYWESAYYIKCIYYNCKTRFYLNI